MSKGKEEKVAVEHIGTVVEPIDGTPDEEMQRKAREYEQTMMHNFQMELGRLSGQAIVDKTNFETAQRQWQQEREQLVKIIDQLNERVANLEGSFPAESGNSQGDGEASTQGEVVAMPAAPRTAPKKKARR